MVAAKFLRSALIISSYSNLMQPCASSAYAFVDSPSPEEKFPLTEALAHL